MTVKLDSTKSLCPCGARYGTLDSETCHTNRSQSAMKHILELIFKHCLELFTHPIYILLTKYGLPPLYFYKYNFSNTDVERTKQMFLKTNSVTLNPSSWLGLGLSL